MKKVKQLRLVFLLFAVVSLLVVTGCESLEMLGVESRLEPGLEALESGNYGKAIELLKTCVEEEGEEGNLASSCRFFLGMAYYRNGQQKEAISHFEKSIELAIKLTKEGRKIDATHALHGIYGTAHYWLGMAYYDSKQYKEAILNFNSALEKAIEDPLGEFRKDWENFSNISYVLFWIRHFGPLFPPKFACYFRLGDAYYSDGQYEQAINAYQKGLELNPHSPDYYTMMGAAYGKLKRYDEAIAAINKAIEIKPSFFSYGVLRNIYDEQGKIEEAIAAGKKAIELLPNQIDLYFSLANLYAKKEDYANMIAIMQKAQEFAPNNYNIPYAIGHTYARLGKFDDAITSLSRAITLLKKPCLKTNFGVVDIQGDYPTVVPIAGLGVDLKAGDKITSINGQSTKGSDLDKIEKMLQEGQVSLLIERKEINKPLERKFNIKKEEITRVEMVNENVGGPLGLRSLIYAIKGDYEKASEDAKLAYSLKPEDEIAKGAMSYSYILNGNLDEAIKILSTLNTPFGSLLECLAYSKKGNLKKSAEVYASIPEGYLLSKDAFRQYFKDAVLKSLTPYVESEKESIKALEAKEQYQEVLKKYANLLKIVEQTKRKEIIGYVAVLLQKKPYLKELPEEARKHAIRAEVMVKEGKFSEAVKEYQEAIKIAPFSPVLYKAIALNYAELKDYKKAIENMNTYIELYPDATDVREAKDEIYKWEFMIEKEGKQ